MGICVSSASMEKEEGGDNVVCMVEEEGWWSPNAARRLASLYSRQGKKGPNQDSAIFCLGYGMEEGVFCGVFDGHGRNGHMVSKLVRDLLPSLVLSQREALLLADGDYDAEGAGDAESSVDFDDCSVSSSPEMFDEWKEACISAFRAMDRELTQHPDLDCCYSGTTAVTVIKQGKDLIIANLGDSRAVLGTLSEGGDPMAVPLTTDLKPSLPHEAERIQRNNGRIFALRDEPNIARVWLPNGDYPGLAMARAFGDFQLKKYGVIAVPQVFYRRLTSRDQFLVLATDGVWDVLSNEQVVSIVWSARSREQASRAVVDAAVRAWRRKFPSSKVDDCSAVCLSLQDWEQDFGAPLEEDR
uniref:protein-serine/threonine phosphatase n=1 Tax=Anthurium amnicola TaxID=1678845 RepID=A0A1D1XCP6_9ARAE